MTTKQNFLKLWRVEDLEFPEIKRMITNELEKMDRIETPWLFKNLTHENISGV